MIHKRTRILKRREKQNFSKLTLQARGIQHAFQFMRHKDSRNILSSGRCTFVSSMTSMLRILSVMETSEPKEDLLLELEEEPRDPREPRLPYRNSSETRLSNFGETVAILVYLYIERWRTLRNMAMIERKFVVFVVTSHEHLTRPQRVYWMRNWVLDIMATSVICDYILQCLCLTSSESVCLHKNRRR